MKKTYFVILIILLVLISISTYSQTIDLSKWNLTWSDEFDYENSKLDERWTAENAAYPTSFLLCSRWRENAVVHDGIVELLAKKESRGGMDWTAASIWTKDKFGYGYFECKYKYAGATGTNNSFWLYPKYGVPTGEKIFELDINEGHYPNEVNTNIHNWTDTWVVNGVTKHADNPVHQTFGGKTVTPNYSYVLDSPIKTKKIRFTSNYGSHFHIREFRIYAPNTAGYPSNVLSETADTDVPGLVNYARAAGTVISSSGEYVTTTQNTSAQNVADGKVIATSWISQSVGQKWLEFDWSDEKTIGAIQFVNGWLSGTTWNALITDYKIQYFDGTQWLDIVNFDAVNGVDFSAEYHTYGLEWNETQFKFYFDGNLIRTESNTECVSKTNILLSLAILKNNIAGAVTDAIDGTSMKVDYVRYYTPKSQTEVALLKSESRMSLFPNPAIDRVNFKAPLNDLYSIEVYNLLVLKCLDLDQVGGNSAILIDKLPAGIYLLKAKGRKYDETIKFQKM